MVDLRKYECARSGVFVRAPVPGCPACRHELPLRGRVADDGERHAPRGAADAQESISVAAGPPRRARGAQTAALVFRPACTVSAVRLVPRVWGDEARNASTRAAILVVLARHRRTGLSWAPSVGCPGFGATLLQESGPCLMKCRGRAGGNKLGGSGGTCTSYEERQPPLAPSLGEPRA